MGRDITHDHITRFTRRLGEDDFRVRQNYFRWLEYPLALTLLQAERDMDVLEVGMGYLSIPPLFLASEIGCRVTAVDKAAYDEKTRRYCEGLMDKAGIAASLLKILSGDARRLPFPDDSFDRVLTISFLEHLPVFQDAQVMAELGRVLKTGGRMVITVPFNLGHHIEVESDGGEEYEQRHYNEYTLRQRVIAPSGLHFVAAAAFGEVDDAVGKRYIEFDPDERVAFCLDNQDRAEEYWREFYRVRNEKFEVPRADLSDEVKKKAGLIALVLEKRDQPLPAGYFRYDPLESHLENRELCKTRQNSDQGVQIQNVRITDAQGAEVSTLRAGEGLRLVIEFHCEGEIFEPHFRIFFHDRFGNVVAGLNVYAAQPLGTLSGHHKLTVDFDKLNLLAGPYDITVGVWEYEMPNPIAPYAFDVHYKKYRVEVNDPPPGLLGSVYLPYHVEVD
ncbi:MAG: Wzt carbohydrate-binding domain-containing protein [Candidatus Lernaella stagnicola]|nr:Wzt carbohydrate-binding domain-containing protein [Candidatus Lernaella stagnicola]